MNPALIAAISTAAVAIIGALTSLIVAVRSNGRSTATAADLAAHKSLEVGTESVPAHPFSETCDGFHVPGRDCNLPAADAKATQP